MKYLSYCLIGMFLIPTFLQSQSMYQEIMDLTEMVRLSQNSKTEVFITGDVSGIEVLRYQEIPSLSSNNSEKKRNSVEQISRGHFELKEDGFYQITGLKLLENTVYIIEHAPGEPITDPAPLSPVYTVDQTHIRASARPEDDLIIGYFKAAPQIELVYKGLLDAGVNKNKLLKADVEQFEAAVFKVTPYKISSGEKPVIPIDSFEPLFEGNSLVPIDEKSFQVRIQSFPDTLRLSSTESSGIAYLFKIESQNGQKDEIYTYDGQIIINEGQFDTDLSDKSEIDVELVYNESIQDYPIRITKRFVGEINSILGANILLRGTDTQDQIFQDPTLWGKIGTSYANNPFLQDELALRNRLSSSFIENLGYDLETALYKKREEKYKWVDVLKDNSLIEEQEQVSMEKVLETYREPIDNSTDELRTYSLAADRTDLQPTQPLNQNTIIQGVSEFLVDRAQDELNITFLERFKAKLNSGDNEFSILFPKTKNLFTQFELTNYQSLLEYSKSSFIGDLKSLGVNFPKLLELEKYRNTTLNSPEVYNLALIYEIANNAYEGQSIDTILLNIHGRLLQRQESLTKGINVELAKQFLKTQGESESDSLIQAFVELEKARDEFLSVVNFEQFQFSDTIQEIQDKVVNAPENYSLGLRQMVQTNANANASLIIQSVDALDTKVFKTYTSLIPQNLKGKENYRFNFEQLALDEIDDYFDNPPTDTQLFAAGLDMVRKAPDFHLSDTYNYFLDQYENLNFNARQASEQVQIEDLKNAQTTIDIIQNQYIKLIRKKLLLFKGLEDSYQFWNQYLPLTEHDKQAFKYLAEAIVIENNNTKVAEKLFEQLVGEEIRANVFEQILKNRMNNLDAPSDIGFALLKLNKLDSTSIMSDEELKGVADSLDFDVIMEGFNYAETYLDTISHRIKYRLNFISNKYGVEKKQVPQNAYESWKRQGETTAINLANGSSDISSMNLGWLSEESKDTSSLKVASIQGKSLELSSIQAGDENPYLQTYQQGIELKSVLDLQFFDEKQETIYKAREKVLAVAAAERKINTLVDTLESRYCGKLVEARQNAANFASVINFSTHLLYFFLDNEKRIITENVFDSIPQTIETREDDGSNVTFQRIALEPRVDTTYEFNKWITREQYNAIIEDELSRKVFLGMMYQRLASLDNSLNISSKGMALMATKLLNTIYDIGDQRKALKLKQESNDKTTFKDYYPFIKTSVDLINTVLTTPFSEDEKPQALSQTYASLARVPNISNEALSLFENVYAEKYGDAIYNAMELLKIIWIESAIEPNQAGEYLEIDGDRIKTVKGIELDALRRRAKRNNRVRNAVILYGTFMAKMVDAQNPADVNTAIQLVALPAGRSRVKREATFNIALNSYFGVGVWSERLTNDAITGSRVSSSVGVSAPIGLSLSKGLGRQWGLGLFFPILDLGAITSVRLNEGEGQSSELPELTFANIIAPGGYLMLHFPKSPFSLGFGAQFGPQTRIISQNNVDIESSAWRIGATFSIDIPLFNLYTGTKIIETE